VFLDFCGCFFQKNIPFFRPGPARPGPARPHAVLGKGPFFCEKMAKKWIKRTRSSRRNHFFLMNKTRLAAFFLWESAIEGRPKKGAKRGPSTSCLRKKRNIEPPLVGATKGHLPPVSEKTKDLETSASRSHAPGRGPGRPGRDRAARALPPAWAVRAVRTGRPSARPLLYFRASPPQGPYFIYIFKLYIYI